MPGKLPDAFTTVGAMGFAALPPSQWTKSMADAAKAFAVSAAADAVLPGARAGYGMRPQMLPTDTASGPAWPGHPLACAFAPASSAGTGRILSKGVFFLSFLRAQGDAIRSSPDRQILGAQQLAVGPTGRQGRRPEERARNPPNCF